jgi:hypothetical protein
LPQVEMSAAPTWPGSAAMSRGEDITAQSENCALACDAFGDAPAPFLEHLSLDENMPIFCERVAPQRANESHLGLGLVPVGRLLHRLRVVTACRGAWARVTIGRCWRLSLKTCSPKTSGSTQNTRDSPDGLVALSLLPLPVPWSRSGSFQAPGRAYLIGHCP